MGILSAWRTQARAVECKACKTNAWRLFHWISDSSENTGEFRGGRSHNPLTFDEPYLLCCYELVTDKEN